MARRGAPPARRRRCASSPQPPRPTPAPLPRCRRPLATSRRSRRGIDCESLRARWVPFTRRRRHPCSSRGITPSANRGSPATVAYSRSPAASRASRWLRNPCRLAALPSLNSTIHAHLKSASGQAQARRPQRPRAQRRRPATKRNARQLASQSDSDPPGSPTAAPRICRVPDCENRVQARRAHMPAVSQAAGARAPTRTGTTAGARRVGTRSCCQAPRLGTPVSGGPRQRGGYRSPRPLRRGQGREG